jgi:hypothetical protein
MTTSATPDLLATLRLLELRLTRLVDDLEARRPAPPAEPMSRRPLLRLVRPDDACDGHFRRNRGDG